MKYLVPQTLKSIANILNIKYVGNDNFTILGQNEIHVVEKKEIVFVDHPKYYKKALASKASVILINKKIECPKDKCLLISDDPFNDFNILTKLFKPVILSNILIDKTSKIGENTIIQPNVFIGANVKIGKNCFIHSGAVINYNSTIKDNVIIHSNVVIGSDAFYYKKRENGYDKLLSGGDVLIENNVEINSGSTVDRGVSGTTTIKKGTKIDNLCHIAHDSIIGERCLLAAHTGVAGCSVIGNDVTIWGRVGINSGVFIGDKAVILACSCVAKSLKGGKTYFGSPAVEHKTKMKEIVAIKKLPAVLEKLRKIL